MGVAGTDPASDDTQPDWDAAGPSAAFFAEDEPPPALDVGAATHRGLVRPDNEDNFLVARRSRRGEVVLTSLPSGDLRAEEDESYLLLVADGVGGAEFGEVASRLAVSKFWELSGRATSWLMKVRDEGSSEPNVRMRHYIETLQRAFADARAEGVLPDRSGTTCTCAYVIGWHAVVANVGDSRGYLFRGGAVRQLTHDHTVAQQLIDRGVPPDQADRFGHVLTQAFGAQGRDIHADVTCVRLRPGDRLLVCSDGLTNEVSEEAIAAELGGPGTAQELCDRLLRLALDAGGRDNVTVTVATVGPG